MSLLDQIATQLTKESLYQLIAMNPAPIGRGALTAAFAHEDNARAQIDALLAELATEKKIASDSDRSYRATAPWADIAYAVVGTVAHDRRKSIPVRLMNLPDGIDVNATMSRAELNKQLLKEGERIVVGLTRCSNGGFGLRARYLAHADNGKSFHLAGTFNHKAHNFTPLDRTIKTCFSLAQEPEPADVPRQFLVELPKGFDIRNPVIHVIGDQTRDVTTGTAISWIITHKHEIAHAHPEDVLRAARRINRRKLDKSGRVDLTHLDFVTVDPLGAQDLDDAFAAETTEDGYAVYTAIADVPALIQYNTAVDREAYNRGVTYYLNDHTSHMLPEVISTRKSSLLAHEDRLAIVVKQSLGWDYALRSFEIIPAIVRSRDQFSYGQFYDLLDREDLRFKIIATVHNARRRNGMNAHLDAFLKDNADRYATKSIVETLMVQTNSLIAQFLKEAGVPFLSRNFEQHSSLEAQKKGLVPRAYYASYHLGHANLGLLHYAHATSPIRRYADIINLRAVHTALGNSALGLHPQEIENLDKSAGHLNNRRRIERDVAHDAQKYHAISDLMRLQAAPIRIGIHEIGQDYIEVTVMQTGLRQRLQAPALPAHQWQIDGAKHELVFLNGQGRELRRYTRGESLLGQVHDVDPGRAQWKISLLPSEQALRLLNTPVARPV